VEKKRNFTPNDRVMVLFHCGRRGTLLFHCFKISIKKSRPPAGVQLGLAGTMFQSACKGCFFGAALEEGQKIRCTDVPRRPDATDAARNGTPLRDNLASQKLAVRAGVAPLADTCML